MILIDRGKLSPESFVEDIVPEFGTLGILEDCTDGSPTLRPPKEKVTIRHLATHTSGLEYELWNPRVADYLAKTSHPSVLSGTRQSLKYPLMSHPGSRWGYGPSVDWLGLVVEAIDGRNIACFCRDEIFAPLGMIDTSFELGQLESERMSQLRARATDGEWEDVELLPPSNPEVYCMGHALYGTSADYTRLLQMFLGVGQRDGRRILSERGANFMLSDQMRGLRFLRMVSCSPLSADYDPFPGVDLTHSFGFQRVERDIDGMRSKGAQGWAGLANCHYWFDPAQNIAAVFMTQSLPFADTRFMQRYREFERAVYAEFGSAS